MDGFQIKEVLTEFQKKPLGLDEEKPRFSWKLGSVEQNCKQSAYRIQIGTESGLNNMWDSGKVMSDNSTEITYQGKALDAATRYYITLTLWDSDYKKAESTDEWFETGLMNASVDAWEGAQWIGAPEKYVSAETMGVFVLSCKIRLEEGSTKAGIVFGANDERLLDARKNQYEIQGENYIRYVLDIGQFPAMLHIIRKGYHPEDNSHIPMASVPVAAYKDRDRQIITRENCYQEHKITVKVTGNNAYTYVDDILVDALEVETPFGIETIPRQLNPLRNNDTTTFPRLCEIGYYVGAGDTACFREMTVRNLRNPQNAVVSLDAEDSVNLCGFDEKGSPLEKQKTFNPDRHSIPMFRRDFTVRSDKEVIRARLYITARGIYDCRINGREITDTWLNPGATQYDKHIMYQTYDISEQIRKGSNGIAITLSSGWWCDSQTYVLTNYNYYGDQESVLAKLVVNYEDGSQEKFVTNTEEWSYYGEGPYRYAGLFHGEYLDGRRLYIYNSFSEPGFYISGMKSPIVINPTKIETEHGKKRAFGRIWPTVDHAKTQITGGYSAPVREVCRIYARKMTQPREGLYIYDLEQEIAGVPVIRFHGKPGTEITIRYGEMLYPKMEEYGSLHGMLLTENYRDAESIDKYILCGDPEGETYIPKFTFHGYRYIEIIGVDTPPALEEVGSIQLSSIKEISGIIETSDKLLNRFIENIKWSQLCNFISIPTDCPQRNERMGWAGDTHVFCRAATYQSDCRLFYYRYLQALADLQEESGQLPDIAPVGGGFGGITYESAMIIMVWELYQQYGDEGVIWKYYEIMKRWCEYIRGKGMPGEAWVGPLGDWLSSEKTDLHLLWNAFYGYDIQLMEKMAVVLSKSEDAKRFGLLKQEALDYWNKTFVDTETGKTRGMDGKINDTQCSYALPLAYQMFSAENRERAYKHLARKVEEAGYTVRTGFFGTGVLNTALTEGGFAEDAYKLMCQTKFPSWLYPVTQGATTIWERWNSYTEADGFGGNNNMNSFNHYSLGSVIAWIYENVLGIKRDEELPGYRHFVLQPQIKVLKYARGGFETAYGRIESSWEIQGSGYIYQCRVPENTTATLRLPRLDGSMKEISLGSGVYTFAEK